MNNRNALNYYDAGFKTLVSVVPPNAPVASHSKIDQKDAGKVPGRMNQQGEYVGYNWMQHQPERHEVHQWLLDGSNVGIGAWDFPAIDIDVTDEHLAKLAIAAVESVMGPCVVRRGRYPKALLIFRSDEPLRSFDVRYEGEHEHPLLGRVRHLIQFLGQGRQYVIDGIHPGTGQPYTLEDPLHAFGLLGAQALPVLTVEKATECFNAISEAYAEAGFEANNTAEARLTAEDVPQESLKAPNLIALEAVVHALPNTTPDRDEYISVGYAIRGASQDDPVAGLNIFQEWCSRWTDGHNDPELVEQDWNKMVGPYRTGYDWLLDKGRKWGVSMARWDFGRAEAPPPETEQPPAEPEPMPEERFTDFHLADEFCKLYADRIRKESGGSGRLFLWTGSQWKVSEDGGLLNRMVKEFMQRKAKSIPFLVEGDGEQKKVISWINQASTLKNITSVVNSADTFLVTPDDMDSDPDIINTPAGPYHLPTGNKLTPDPSMPLFQSTAVAPDPDCHCPVFKRSLSEWMHGDQEMLRYIQKFAGYALTGHTREQMFPFFLGTGQNGKSRFIQVFLQVLGDYGVSIPVELLQNKSRGGSDEYNMASLHGKRFAVTSETQIGVSWDEQKVKLLTGGDTLNARKPYGRPFSFKMRATLVAVGNHSPELQSAGDAMSRRVHVVPWTYKPMQPNVMLEQELEKEMPGILGWALEGAKMWYEEGLGKPRVVAEETDDYFFDQDAVGAWISDCLDIDQSMAEQGEGFVTSKELYDNYTSWFSTMPGRPYGYHRFMQMAGPRLMSEGARRNRKGRHDGGSGRGYVGIKMTLPDEHLPPNVSRFPAEAPEVPITSMR